MGRKGISKRKPKQTNSKAAASDKSGGMVSAAMAADTMPTKTFDTSKTAVKPTIDRKKSSK